MPTYKLYYLDGRARAETIRFMFLHAGVDFEDIRMPWETEFPKHKEKFPYFQVPVLEEDGKILAQSDAITMYLAKKFGMAGENDWEEAKIHELVALGNDMMSICSPYILEKDITKKKQILADLVKDRLIPLFQRLDETIAKSESGYFVGKKISAADFEVFQFYDWYRIEYPDLPKDFKHLNEFAQKIEALPEIKKWLETRHATEY